MTNRSGVARHSLSEYSRALLGFPSDAWQAFVTALPGPVGYTLRREFWRPRLRRMGQGVMIDVGVQFTGSRYIELADNCWLESNVLIEAGPPLHVRSTRTIDLPDFPLAEGEVYIGENVRIAPKCVLNGMGGLFVGRNTGIAAHSSVYSITHHYRLDSEQGPSQASMSTRARLDQQSMLVGPVYIGESCGVGVGCTILPCTSLGRGTWIACGQVVRGTYGPQTLVRDVAQGGIGSLADLPIRE